MAYSTIIKKTCKCGCGKPYSLGYNGYRFSCAPEDVLEKVGSKKKVADKNRATRNTIARKLHGAQRELDPMKDFKETWFRNTRKRLTGICQCGCGNKSQKNDDMYFRHSCCHIFPKGKFQSIQYHPLNYVERAFFGGCHGILDDTSMDRWVNMSDWGDIKEKFHILAPLLTDEERATKFYTHLETLIYKP